MIQKNTDYNTIFYRDDVGSICSDDEKGRDMINRIKLYRPIHNLLLICEITKNTLEKINKQIEIEGKESPKGILLLKAKNELNDYYNDCLDVFLANYNNGKYINGKVAVNSMNKNILRKRILKYLRREKCIIVYLVGV